MEKECSLCKWLLGLGCVAIASRALLDLRYDLACLGSKCKALLRLGLTVCYFTDGSTNF